uniref:Uncharacterized protein n=1 Tax=Vitis vinifera TaxID=29760 RepID=F6H354_VITVI
MDNLKYVMLYARPYIFFVVTWKI